MTEIMPVPRNSHITVLRPPSIGSVLFSVCTAYSGDLQALTVSLLTVHGFWYMAKGGYKKSPMPAGAAGQ